MASNASVPVRGLPPKPPDKGSFLLDHFRVCTEAKERYLECLRSHTMRGDAEDCRKLSATYLQCRMDEKLMLREDLEKLGYYKTSGDKDAFTTASAESNAFHSAAREQNQRGFVAGVPAPK